MENTQSKNQNRSIGTIFEKKDGWKICEMGSDFDE